MNSQFKALNCAPLFSRLHSWGDTVEEAFEQAVMAMFGYMTDIETVQPLTTLEVKAEGCLTSVVNTLWLI